MEARKVGEIRFHASRKKTESFLANLINSQPNKRAAVRDLEIYVHPEVCRAHGRPFEVL
jgi:hypothetical protein